MQPSSTPMNITGLQVLGIIFVLVVAVEVGLATSSTGNYFQFYRALAQMQVNLTLEVSPLQGVQNANSNVTALFSIENPTSYQSLIMMDLGGSFIVVNSTSGSLIQGTTAFSATSPSTHLDPSTVLNVIVEFPMLLPATNYKFMFTATLDLSTFLDTLSLVQSSFSCDTSQSQTCTLASITARSIGLPGGGGGL